MVLFVRFRCNCLRASGWGGVRLFVLLFFSVFRYSRQRDGFVFPDDDPARRLLVMAIPATTAGASTFSCIRPVFLGAEVGRSLTGSALTPCPVQ